jgi:hypothetical protein
MWVSKKTKTGTWKKHKQGNKKKNFQNSSIVFLCYRAQSAYKRVLYSTKAKLMRKQVDTTPRYGEQLPFQRRPMFFCTDSSDRPAYVLSQFDSGRLFTVALNCSSRTDFHWLRNSLQHKLFVEINWHSIFFSSGTAFLPPLTLLRIAR